MELKLWVAEKDRPNKGSSRNKSDSFDDLWLLPTDWQPLPDPLARKANGNIQHSNGNGRYERTESWSSLHNNENLAYHRELTVRPSQLNDLIPQRGNNKHLLQLRWTNKKKILIQVAIVGSLLECMTASLLGQVEVPRSANLGRPGTF